MRFFLLSLCGVVAASAAPLATVSRAQDHLGLRPPAYQDQALAKAYAQAAKQDLRVSRALEDQRRREEIVERSRLRLEQRQLEWQRWGDRRAYRRLRNAHEDLLKDQRIRDEIARRNQLLLQTPPGQLGQSPLVPSPLHPVPGLRAAPPAQYTPYTPSPELMPTPDFGPGPELLPAPGTPTPARPAPAPGPSLRPVLPAPSDDPIPAGAQEF